MCLSQILGVDELAMSRSLGKNSAVLLEKIKESLDKLNEKMEVFIEIQKHERKQDFAVQDLPEALDVMTLLSLPKMK